MSRLATRYKRNTSHRLVKILIVAGGLLMFFFLGGLPSLINSSIYLRSLISTPQEQSANSNETFYGLLSINEPQQATNEARMTISGSADGFERITVFLNKDKNISTSVKNGTFSLTPEDFTPGENDIYLIATTKDGKHTKKSESFTLTYFDKAPTIELVTPHDHDAVTKPDIRIEGKTNPGVSLRVNRNPVVVDWQGNFNTSIRLKEGENAIEATAVDDAGNTVTSKVSVTYRRDE